MPKITSTDLREVEATKKRTQLQQLLCSDVTRCVDKIFYWPLQWPGSAICSLYMCVSVCLSMCRNETLFTRQKLKFV